MRQDLDHLQYLALAADRRGDLVLTRELVERDTEVSEERRQLVFLPYSFLFFFSLAYSGPSGLRNFLGRHSQILQNVIEHTSLVVRKDVKNIAAIYHPAALGPGTVHGTFKKLGRLRCDAIAFAAVLAAGVHPFFDKQLYGTRVDREVAHSRREKLFFLKSDRMQDMLDRDVVLIAFF